MVAINDSSDLTPSQPEKMAEARGAVYHSVQDAPDWDVLVQEMTGGSGFDDVILVGTLSPELFEGLAKSIAKGGVMAISPMSP